MSEISPYIATANGASATRVSAMSSEARSAGSVTAAKKARTPSTIASDSAAVLGFLTSKHAPPYPMLATSNISVTSSMIADCRCSI